MIFDAMGKNRQNDHFDSISSHLIEYIITLFYFIFHFLSSYPALLLLYCLHPVYSLVLLCQISYTGSIKVHLIISYLIIYK